MTSLNNPSRSTLPLSLQTHRPDELQAALQNGEAVLVDVREPFERRAEWIAGSVAMPLSAFDGLRLRENHAGQRLVFHCRSGGRSSDAAKRFHKATGESEVFHLAGGIEAWKGAGQPVERNESAPKLDIMRQVQMVAGGLIATGTMLGAVVSPWFLVLPGGVGCGLFFAGASGWCGMAKLLAKMPWNRSGGGSSCTLS